MNLAESLIDADRVRRAAMINAQTGLLSGIFDDDLLWIHASGTIDSKRSLLGSIDSGRLDYKSIEPSNERVRLYDSIGLITGSIALNVAIDHVARDARNLFTSVWRHTASGWRLVNWQTSRWEG
jgi:hypothetical protein